MLTQPFSSVGMFSSGNLIASFIISTIGFSYFIYGKKQGHTMALISGLLLMLYPYFVYDIRYMIAIGMLFCIIPFFVRL